MEQVPDSSASNPQSAALSKSWAAWDEYYQEAARRRHSTGSHHLHGEKRRRRIRERLGLTVSTALVGGLLLLFYHLLTR